MFAPNFSPTEKTKQNKTKQKQKRFPEENEHSSVLCLGSFLGGAVREWQGVQGKAGN